VPNARSVKSRLINMSKVQPHVTYVGIIEDGNHNPVEDNESSEDVNLSPPWDHKRASDPRNLRPIKRHDTHSQTAIYPKELIDRDIPGEDPANPRKYRERREQEP